MIEALSKLNKQIRDFEYHIIGSGEYLKICKQKVVEFGLSDKVIFHGYIPYYDNKLVNFYQEADLFILPSITLKDYDKEGIPKYNSGGYGKWIAYYKYYTMLVYRALLRMERRVY